MPRKVKAKSKAKAKAKAKASAKVVSNIQNKIIIGDVKSKAKKRAPRKQGGVKSAPTTIQNIYQPQVASYAQPSPFVNSSTRLLEEQPRMNLLAERLNRLELASLYRPAQQQNIPMAEAMAIPEEPMKAEAPDYFDSQYARSLEKAQNLIENEKEPINNFIREPRIPKKKPNLLIEEDEEPVKSDVPEPVAIGTPEKTESPDKKTRKTDRQKMETKLRTDVRNARAKYNDAMITINVKSQYGGPLPSNIKRKELWEQRLTQAEKALEEFYNNNPDMS
jgi:hypothetical protein